MGAGDEVLVYGPPEAGKSFFAVDLSCRWATGEPWRGREVRRGLVAYLAGERKRSIENRIRAWLVRNGKTARDCPVMVLQQPLNLLAADAAEVAAVAGEITAGAREVKLPVVAIVLDTIHALSPGSKEDNHSFGLVIDKARRLRATVGQEEPIALVYLHHTGKDEDRGPRGGNSLPAGMSLSMAISVRLDRYRLAEVDKNNDLAERPHVEPFVIEDATVGHDGDRPVKVGVHVAIPITEVPNPPEEGLRRMAHAMARTHSIRSIARTVGRSASTVHGWLNEASEKPSKRRAA
jgi:hypothetical protein